MSSCALRVEACGFSGFVGHPRIFGGISGYRVEFPGLKSPIAGRFKRGLSGPSYRETNLEKVGGEAHQLVGFAVGGAV